MAWLGNLPVGERNTGANVGTGSEVFKDKTGLSLRFRTLVAGTNITLSEGADEITIDGSAAGEINTASNVGGGNEVFKSKSVADLRFRTLVAGTNITLTQGTDTITVAASSGVAGETNTASNVGAGADVFKQKTGVDLEFRSLVAGSNISIAEGASDITITGTGEANTASNLGATGVGLFKAKTGVNLAFRKIKAGSGVSITTDAADEILTIATAGGSAANNEVSLVDYLPAGFLYFVPTAGSQGSGTDASSAMDAALNTGRPVYVPAGNYYLASGTTIDRAARSHLSGPGILWGTVSGYGIIPVGESLPLGTARAGTFPYSGGLNLGGKDTGYGARLFAARHNWAALTPSRSGVPGVLQIGSTAKTGTATQQSPNRLNLLQGAFTGIVVGDYIGFGGTIYKVTANGGTYLTVNTTANVSPAFTTSSTERTWLHAYETSTGTCNTAGTAVTYVSGEQFPFGATTDHKTATINGTAYTVSSGPESTNANSLTLSTSAGTQAGVAITFRRCATDQLVSGLRLLGVSGVKESSGFLGVDLSGDLVLGTKASATGMRGALRLDAQSVAAGDRTTTSSDWFGTFTETKLKLGMGVSGTPTSDHMSAMFTETFTSGPHTLGHFFTSGHFVRSVREGVNASGAMMAATFQVEDRSTGESYHTLGYPGNAGDHIACHGVGLVENTRPGAGAAAFWGEAGTPRTNTGTSWCAGMELNVYQRFTRNASSNYLGDPLIDVAGAGHGCSMGLWVQNFQWAARYVGGSAGDYWNDFGISLTSGTTVPTGLPAPNDYVFTRAFGYQTGIYITDTYNEAIRIRGGIGDKIANTAYKTDTGLHFEGQFWKGIRLDSATCHDYAVHFGANRVRYAAYTNPGPADGDFWFDGTNLKFRVGGVTRTLTWA